MALFFSRSKPLSLSRVIDPLNAAEAPGAVSQRSGDNARGGGQHQVHDEFGPLILGRRRPLGPGLREKTRYPDQKAKQAHHDRFEGGRETGEDADNDANSSSNVAKPGEVSQSQPIGSQAGTMLAV